MIDPKDMKAVTEMLASCLEVGYEGCPALEGLDCSAPRDIPAIHRHGTTLEVVIGGEVYVAEFRHVDDEVV